MKSIITAILGIAPLHAVTIWNSSANALASASWDSFTFQSTAVGESGSHGSAQATTGTLIIASDLSTEILDSYEFPGGILGGGDSYYSHTGGYEWTASADFSETVGYLRISYSLVGAMGAPSPFPNAPSITGATEIGSGSYTTGNNTVFFTDFAFDFPSSSFSASFGDIVFPNFPGSFRSIDGVQFEVFDAVPVPEPSSALFFFASSALFLRRRR